MKGGILSMRTLSCVVALLAAAASAEGAVYEIQMTVKSTVMKEGKADNVCGDAGKIAYRKESTQKFKGVIWGSACEADSGAVFWNDTCRKPYVADFGWEFLNRIDTSAQRAEGFCTLSIDDVTGDDAGRFWLAGFGAVKDRKADKKSGAGVDLSGSYVASFSGSLVGWLYLGKLVRVIEKDCTRCDSGVSVEEVDVSAWALCSCDLVNDSRTAAHGSWSMKYNEKASARLAEGGDIDDAYSFPKFVQTNR